MMAKTFDEIIARFDDCHAYDGDDVIEALNAARDAVGGDPHEWWVEDADGNRVHIGDDVRNYHGHAHAVVGFSIRYGQRSVEYKDGFDYADTVHKVIPETRERIVEDTLDRLLNAPESDKATAWEIIADAVDRAMNLAGEDA